MEPPCMLCPRPGGILCPARSIFPPARNPGRFSGLPPDWDFHLIIDFPRFREYKLEHPFRQIQLPKLADVHAYAGAQPWNGSEALHIPDRLDWKFFFSYGPTVYACLPAPNRGPAGAGLDTPDGIWAAPAAASTYSSDGSFQPSEGLAGIGRNRLV